MAIGDSDNDREMIQECGVKIAVKNAVDILKGQADYICNGANIYGVSESIRKFYV